MILDQHTLVIADREGEKWVRKASTSAQILTIFDGWITHPFGCTMRNVLAMVYGEEIQRIYVLVQEKEPTSVLQQMKEAGISEDVLRTVSYVPHVEGDVARWLDGLSSTKDNVKKSVEIINNHPFMPKQIRAEGWFIDCNGELYKYN
ncbi:hypothetical protein P6P90_10495 [Ectobacillus antri]|jgi:carbonic anhydrase|uniref:Uncharacterized protein n=1 Tax=Ectobacillus antri TaxID=2486280 RepID=A0ABT6H6Q0_9BACI|nr:hypothetical protein [Ectobacillus antri]MDG4657249.1 hypothetical protein [Ectobacillus antri]MDG5754399.1 hypothetical protein [Ectobacillus antri]